MVILLVFGFAGIGFYAFERMTFDAFPDLTNTQVVILTSSPGLAAEEVELLVTVPVERAVTGTPGLAELRSLSRTGISSVTAVFEDGTDLYHARQLVQARLESARGDIPPGIDLPQLGPPTTGLGEVYQFSVSSDVRSLEEITRIYERDIAPRLAAISGVVEVNAWGLAQPQLEIRVDPFSLATLRLSLPEFLASVEGNLGRTAGGVQYGPTEQRVVLSDANPQTPLELEETRLLLSERALRLGDMSRVRLGRRPTNGLASADGTGEQIYAVVQLLAGADALQVVRDVRERMVGIQASIPDDVRIDVVYDRERLVMSTLHTVARSLIEGGIFVLLVLLLMLGDLRAGLIVASVIPLSMLGAFTGMYFLGFSGNLMSLGAIDFGMVVDGSVVVIESIIAAQVAGDKDLRDTVIGRTQSVGVPVLFAVGILVLVYVPVVAMQGTEGRLFRPMAVTVLLALGTALVLTFTWVPAIASLLIRPSGHHQTPLVRWMDRAYVPVLTTMLKRPGMAATFAAGLIGTSVAIGSTMGIEFVPRLDEGDLVLQTARLPSITRDLALSEATRIERLLRDIPEVQRIASRIGAPAMATDPMGIEEADMIVHLRPRDEWTNAHSSEELVAQMEALVEEFAPGAELKFTQPIEMRFNELLQGIRTDVGVIVYGADLETLLELGSQIAVALESVDGAADVVAPSQEGVPALRIHPNNDMLAQLGLTADDIFMQVRSLVQGQQVGEVIRGQFRDPVVVQFDIPVGFPIEQTPIVLPSGRSVPLEVVADTEYRVGPVSINRQAGSRRAIVECNVRGRDIGSFVAAAQQAVNDGVVLPEGYWIEWGGKMEQMRQAARRTAMMIPALLVAIFLILFFVLGGARVAGLILLNIPVAVSGGVIMLKVLGMPISMSAIVGFIALAGIAVMNGIVMLARTRELHRTMDAMSASRQAGIERMRPVMTTALVAGIGFLPMALAHGSGAEVQRPLAVVVIGGLITSLMLTLVLLPSLYALVMKRYDPAPENGEES
jgi:cobalt-zinc-cadmium resistance protein CzcA